MSMGLDSPMEMEMEMEMIAINYLKSHAFLATHFWAWIAFLTAAISFSWKIKSSIIHSPHHSVTPSSSSSNHQPPHLDDDDDDDDDQLLSTTPNSLTSSTTCTFYRLENRRSGKFSLHYEQADAHDNINIHNDKQYLEEEEEEEEEEDRGMGVVVDYDDDEEQEESMIDTCSLSIKHNYTYNYKDDDDDDGYLEAHDVVVMKMQTREMGWYLYQDLSILDGNVVRFWSTDYA